MKLAYRTKLLLGFELVVAITATVITWAGFSFISRTVTKEAMLRVEMDLGGAWSAYEAEKSRLQTVVGMASQRESLREALRFRRGLDTISGELDALRRKYDLDFLSLADSQGRVVARGRSPYAAGERAWASPILRRALSGTAGVGTVVVPAEALGAEGEELATRAYIPVVYTERALPTTRIAEDRGLALQTAIPILDPSERVLGVLYGGILLNRKFALVDRIRDVVFGNKTYEGKPVGTVTLFLGDVRIATNVMLDPGTRALGTRVSGEVYDKVLVRGQRFADRAFVVNDWYLSAYDPIRDPEGRIIGIIYVGLLEKKYLEYRSGLAMQFLGISFLALVLSGAVAFSVSGGFRGPVRRLVQATREVSAGNLKTRVHVDRASREMVELAQAFNSMTDALEVRTGELQQASSALEKALAEAEDKNRAYLETLGFVTHELKSPLASIVFAIGSLREHILGPLNESQEALLKAAANSAEYLRSTIANYLNLSRIEEGELKLTPTPVSFRSDILDPLLGRVSELAADRKMRIVCSVPEDLVGTCDRDQIACVFQNLLSNAIKYGREQGEIRIGTEQDSRTGLRQFNVWNEGPGFDRDAAEKLFQKFFRLGAAAASTKPGTGLGLFVSRKIVERHGGRLWAESEPGQWANFVFTVPLSPGRSDPSRA
jgi:two-component system NtrC family sensor kinase